MNFHAHLDLRRAGLLALLTAALLAGCGSGSKHSSRTQGTSTPAGQTASTATATGASTTHRSKKSSTASATPGSTRSHTGTTHSRSASTPLPSVHLHTAAAGGCPPGTSPCVSKSTSVKPIGPYRIDANLVQELAREHPTIKQAVVTCRAAKSYPVSCTLTGRAPIHGHVVPIKGTITVLGVEVRTRTYAYETIYAPAHAG